MWASLLSRNTLLLFQSSCPLLLASRLRKSETFVHEPPGNQGGLEILDSTSSPLPRACDETNGADGLRGWWSRRRLPVHRVTTRAHFILKEETIANFSPSACSSKVERARQSPGHPWEAQPKVNGLPSSLEPHRPHGLRAGLRRLSGHFHFPPGWGSSGRLSLCRPLQCSCAACEVQSFNSSNICPARNPLAWSRAVRNEPTTGCSGLHDPLQEAL